MLKSDPNVDLVHFTILRPPQKLDSTPVSELSLIAFPTRELFEVKIKDFDLIILDRYSDMVMMPPAYFRNMVNYVRDGGAMLTLSALRPGKAWASCASGSGSRSCRACSSTATASGWLLDC